MDVKLLCSPVIRYASLPSDKVTQIDSKGPSVGSALSALGLSFSKHLYYAFRFELSLEVAYVLATSRLTLTSSWDHKKGLEVGTLSGSVADYEIAMLELCTESEDKTIRAVFNTINTFFERDKLFLNINKVDTGDSTYAIIRRR